MLPPRPRKYRTAYSNNYPTQNVTSTEDEKSDFLMEERMNSLWSVPALPVTIEDSLQVC